MKKSSSSRNAQIPKHEFSSKVQNWNEEFGKLDKLWFAKRSATFRGVPWENSKNLCPNGMLCAGVWSASEHAGSETDENVVHLLLKSVFHFPGSEMKARQQKWEQEINPHGSFKTRPAFSRPIQWWVSAGFPSVLFDPPIVQTHQKRRFGSKFGDWQGITTHHWTSDRSCASLPDFLHATDEMHFTNLHVKLLVEGFIGFDSFITRLDVIWTDTLLKSLV